jgi:hypothetical protein
VTGTKFCGENISGGGPDPEQTVNTLQQSQSQGNGAQSSGAAPSNGNTSASGDISQTNGQEDVATNNSGSTQMNSFLSGQGGDNQPSVLDTIIQVGSLVLDEVPNIFEQGARNQSNNSRGLTDIVGDITGASAIIDGGIAATQGDLGGLEQAAVSAVAGKARASAKLVSKFREPKGTSKADLLRQGKDVHVKDVKEAREILDSMLELRPGPGNVSPGFRDRRNTFRGDLINTKDPTSSKIHDRGKHANQPHFNIDIRDKNGVRHKPAIFIDD